jgi:hypothetical protein
MNEIDYSPITPAAPEDPQAVIGFDRDHCHGEHCVPESSALFPIISFLVVVLLTRWLRGRHRAKRRRPLLLGHL